MLLILENVHVHVYTCMQPLSADLRPLQVQQWNQDVLEYLASLPLEDMTSMEATTHLSRIDDLHDVIHVSQLTTVTELANSLPGEKKFKKMAEKAKDK